MLRILKLAERQNKDRNRLDNFSGRRAKNAKLKTAIISSAPMSSKSLAIF